MQEQDNPRGLFGDPHYITKLRKDPICRFEVIAL